VIHDGKKELIVQAFGSLHDADYPGLCKAMTKEIAANIRDPSVREWVMPNFSTTTDVDKVVGAIALMSSMKTYFDYKFQLMCGLPSVTLMGEVGDWEEIEKRAARLISFDTDKKHVTKWYNLLRPILAQFTQSAKGSPNINFWNRVCSNFGGGSGPSWLSGWITAFTIFDDKGVWRGDQTKAGRQYQDLHKEWAPEGWPILDTNDISSGVCIVPVTVDDNGEIHKCVLSAGHDAYTTPVATQTSIQPRVSWNLTESQ
jgi:hypothetical protein